MLQPRLKSVEALDSLQLFLVYETGEKKIFDAKPYANGPWYGELNDPVYFRTVRMPRILLPMSCMSLEYQYE